MKSLEEALVQEAREDIKAVKESLSSIDKNLTIAVTELQNQRKDLDKLRQDHDALSEQVQGHDRHISGVGYVFKAITIACALIVGVFELIPIIKDLIK